MSFSKPHPKIPPIVAPAGKNWAGNLTYAARSFVEPQTRAELEAVLTQTTGPVKIVGSRHCFNNIADTDGTLISLAGLDSLQDEPSPGLPDSSGTQALGGTPASDQLEVFSAPERPGHSYVKVPGAITYGALAQILASSGWALSNFASLPHISVAGSIATGTHGSGNGSPALIDQIRTIEFMAPSGQVLWARRSESEASDIPFEAAVHLGALGVVLSVEVYVEPQYQVRQDVFVGLDWDRVWSHFDEVTGAAYSVSLFTRWLPNEVDQVWVKSRLDGDLSAAAQDEFLGAKRSGTKRHPLPDVDPVHCTDQLGVPGPSHERLPHFKMGFTPSNGEELQSEYLIPRRNATAAIGAVLALGEKIRPLLFISEIRTMAADGMWLSPSGQEDSVGLHFTWHQDEVAVMRLLPEIEAALAPFDARPHWGKLHSFTNEQLARLYPRLGDFVTLARSCDPEHRLVNSYLSEHLGL